MSEARKINHLPNVVDLMPHADPMILIKELLDCNDQSATCLIQVGQGLSPTLGNQMVPVWVSIEYLAQTVAVCAGFNSKGQDSQEIGFLMGVRKAVFGERHFCMGDLIYAAVELSYDDGKMAQFTGRVFDPDSNYEYASAVLSVYRPEDQEGLINSE